MLRTRAARVLQIAAAHRHRQLVLGAWGCGVFSNDPAVVAAAFAHALSRALWFDHIVFAIHDRQPRTPSTRPSLPHSPVGSPLFQGMRHANLGLP